jgi:hypothetical protein
VFLNLNHYYDGGQGPDKNTSYRDRGGVKNVFCLSWSVSGHFDSKKCNDRQKHIFNSLPSGDDFLVWSLSAIVHYTRVRQQGGCLTGVDETCWNGNPANNTR